jgi:uncharacterized protein (TIGR02594 family)
MPYIPGSGRISDVYRSGNVFVNSVPVALWLAPGVSASVSLPEFNLITLSPEQEEAIAASAAAANSQAEAEVGLSGVGEVPQEGPAEKVSTNAEIAADTTATSTATTATGTVFIDLARNIDLCLSEAKQNLWKETGSTARILAAYKAVGFNLASDSTPWCAAFAGSVLKNVGVRSLKTLSSLAYRNFGTSVPVTDKTKWRLNDIVIFSRNGGGHIGFFRGYNKANGSVLIAGGNQSDNLTEVGFKSAGMPIVYVGRDWEVPNEYDREVTYSGSGGSIKVV